MMPHTYGKPLNKHLDIQLLGSSLKQYRMPITSDDLFKGWQQIRTFLQLPHIKEDIRRDSQRPDNVSIVRREKPGS